MKLPIFDPIFSNKKYEKAGTEFEAMMTQAGGYNGYFIVVNYILDKNYILEQSRSKLSTFKLLLSSTNTRLMPWLLVLTLNAIFVDVLPRENQVD